VNRIRHYLSDGESTLLEFLVHRVALTTEQAKRLLLFGAVYHNRERILCDRSLSPGEYIRVHIEPKRFPADAVDWPASVVQETDEFVVVNKPAGVPVHATVDNRLENVLYQLGSALHTTFYITQRLDTDVCGLLVLAKTREFQRQFNQLLIERRVKKTYRALVASRPALGRHVHYMNISDRSPKTVSTVNAANTVECVLRINDVKPVPCSGSETCFDVEIDLETGRTHQIRAQLSAMGSPVVGDAMYGSKSRYEPGIALFSAATSWSLEDSSPTQFALLPPWESRLPSPSG